MILLVKTFLTNNLEEKLATYILKFIKIVRKVWIPYSPVRKSTPSRPAASARSLTIAVASGDIDNIDIDVHSQSPTRCCCCCHPFRVLWLLPDRHLHRRCCPNCCCPQLRPPGNDCAGCDAGAGGHGDAAGGGTDTVPPQRRRHSGDCCSCRPRPHYREATVQCSGRWACRQWCSLSALGGLHARTRERRFC